MKRLLAAASMLLCASTAHAEKFFAPVYIKQTSPYCRTLVEIQYRAKLKREQRQEALAEQRTMSAFTGNCGTAFEGKWMFFDGYNGRYICLRPRPGADCVWMEREAAGEIVALFPGRTFEQGNKGVSCSAWAAVVQKSRATEKDIMAKWRGHASKTSQGQEIIGNIITGTLGMTTPSQISHANACLMYSLTAQERGRRLTAYDWCPTIADPATKAEDRAQYTALIKEITLSCLR